MHDGAREPRCWNSENPKAKCAGQYPNEKKKERKKEQENPM